MEKKLKVLLIFNLVVFIFVLTMSIGFLVKLTNSNSNADTVVIKKNNPPIIEEEDGKDEVENFSITYYEYEV